MNTVRLLQLANFLDALPEEAFDFQLFVSRSEFRDGKHCGTICCAVGWLPAVFPNLCDWVEIAGNTWVMTAAKESNFYAAARIFSMSMDQVETLFSPSSHKRRWLGQVVDVDADGHLVARSIRAYVEANK